MRGRRARGSVIASVSYKHASWSPSGLGGDEETESAVEIGWTTKITVVAR